MSEVFDVAIVGFGPALDDIHHVLQLVERHKRDIKIASLG